MLKKIHAYRFQLAFLAILLFLIFTRFIGNSFDAGLHLHPDERWLVMVAGKIKLFSQLNPNFFAYGTLPIYILKLASQGLDTFFHTKLDNYDGLLMVGRTLASLVDIVVAILVFFIARQLTKNKLAPFFAFAFYALMFFPIQNSNFFIVDNFLNLFLTLTVFLAIKYLKKPSWLTFVGLVIVSAAMLATKVTAIVILPIIFGLVFLKLILQEKNKRKKLCNLFIGLNLTLFVGILSFFVFMPYGLINWSQFIKEVTNQLKMGKDPYVFPYTLQYVGTTPYFYYLKNIFFWGAGPIISLLGLGGIFVASKQLVKYKKKHSFSTILTHPISLVFLVYLIYFSVVGHTAVKFMRYMLPLYPFIALSAGFLVGWFLTKTKLNKKLKYLFVGLVLFFTSIWLSAFLKIYLKPHTRIQATNWMLSHIPAGSTLAIEHWDDRLPLYGAGHYQFVELPLYEYPDDQRKWQLVNSRLDQADYIIIASKRLFTPLTKLNSCQKYKKCYPETARYYQELFSGKRGFKKVAEFDFQPILNFGLFKIQLDDNGADESFSVYDHPHVIIFQKIQNQ